MAALIVCRLDELPPGARRVVEVDGRAIGVVNTGKGLYAFRDVCPHQGASLCAGTVGGTMLPADPHEYVYGLEAQVIRCPWHGWEFDLETGRALFDPAKRVKTFPVSVEDGVVVVDA